MTLVDDLANQIEHMSKALKALRGWDQLTLCCQPGSEFHDGHNPDLLWARTIIEEVLRAPIRSSGDAAGPGDQVDIR